MRVRKRGEQQSSEAAPAEATPYEPAAVTTLGSSALAMGESAVQQATRAARTRAEGPAVPQPAAGAPLPPPLLRFFEQRFGRDFSGVRVHTDAEADREARAVDARAFTTGSDVVFGAGEFQPDSASGQALIAHELAHVAQQVGPHEGGALAVSRPGDASEREAHSLAALALAPGPALPLQVNQQVPVQIARQPKRESDMPDYAGDPRARLPRPVRPDPPEWDDAWAQKNVKNPGGDLANLEKQIGAPGGLPAMQAASAHGGTGTQISPTALTPEDIKEIMNPKPPEPGAIPDDKAHATERDNVDRNAVSMLGHIHTAFSIMQIDTIQAQSLYLAHSYAESKKLTELEEKGADKEPYAPFIGRGPKQVTWPAGYLKAMAYMETRSRQLAGKPGREADVKLLDEAVRDIKRDIKLAATPKYAFLFSAAFMHMRGVKGSSSLGSTAGFPGNAVEDAGMTGQTKPWQQSLDERNAAEAVLRDSKDPRERATAEAQLRTLPTRQHLDSAIRGANQKSGAYGRAFRVLTKRAAVLKAAAAAAQSQPGAPVQPGAPTPPVKKP